MQKTAKGKAKNAAKTGLGRWAPQVFQTSCNFPGKNGKSKEKSAKQVQKQIRTSWANISFAKNAIYQVKCKARTILGPADQT
jgi:hypothetical protein